MLKGNGKLSRELSFMAEMTRLKEMVSALAGAPKEVLPSRMWQELNARHIHELETYGYENFKQTLTSKYFTWFNGPRHEHTRYLRDHLPRSFLFKNFIKALFSGNHALLSRRNAFNYNFFTLMLWDFVARNDTHQALAGLSEPQEGNPPRLTLNGKLISQDLANSVLEFNSIMESGIQKESQMTLLELGAGYGRTAFVFLKLMPRIRYIVVDIPPALYVSERYLSGQFTEKQLFKFRDFKSYSQVQDEFEASNLAFLLPHQLELLPAKRVNLFINISSLAEMRPDQIQYYFDQVDRLTKGYFYFKQSAASTVSGENLIIREKDYPIPEHWTGIYRRKCPVQTNFFEALFAV